MRFLRYVLELATLPLVLGQLVFSGSASGGGGGGGTSGSGSITFGAIADGAIASGTFTLTGATTGMKVQPAWPAALTAGLVGVMLVSAADTVQVRLANLSGASITLGALTFGATVS